MSAVIATDETLIIETPERVPLHFALASIGNRFIACAIDHAIQAFAFAVMVIAFIFISNFASFEDTVQNLPKWVIALLVILVFVIMDGYFVAGTVVVREREAEAPAFSEVFASPVSDPALRRSFKPAQFTADLNLLSEREIAVVETFLRRRWDLRDYPRQWMAWRVSMPILFKLRPKYDL